MKSEENFLDWDMMDNYYNNDGKEIGGIEDFISDDDDFEDSFEASILDADKKEVVKVANDVKNVREMVADGITVKEISEKLNLDQEYVTDIAIILNSTTEDEDDIAVAHMMLM